jgi:MraZ protein
LFQGSAVNGVDAKGRLSIPAAFRAVVERRGDQQCLVLAKHDHFDCLMAYDPGYAASRHARLERKLDRDDSAENEFAFAAASLMAFGATEEVGYDKSGRIVLPPIMRRKGGIGDVALFVGAGDTFQIWNPERLLADPRVPEDLKDIVRFRLEDRGA